jgi:hypothetical protein
MMVLVREVGFTHVQGPLVSGAMSAEIIGAMLSSKQNY